jgi:hypothetical protein
MFVLFSIVLSSSQHQVDPKSILLSLRAYTAEFSLPFFCRGLFCYAILNSINVIAMAVSLSHPPCYLISFFVIFLVCLTASSMLTVA